MQSKILIFLILFSLGCSSTVLAEEISVVDADSIWNLTLDDATDIGRLIGEPTIMVVKYADAFSYKSLENPTLLGRLVGEPGVMVVKYADAINYKPLENATEVKRLVGEPGVIVVKYADDRSWLSELIRFGAIPDGDIDGSGKFNWDDVIYLAKHFYGPVLFPGYETVYANVDIDCSGNFDWDDVIYLAKYFYGPDLFPGYETLYPCNT